MLYAIGQQGWFGNYPVSEVRKAGFDELEAGVELAPAVFTMDSSTVASYIAAVRESSPLYQGTGLVPPTAVAARAMAALAGMVILQPGTIHIGQELEFLCKVRVGDTLTSHTRVARNMKRGKFHILAFDITVSNQDQETVLKGSTSFMLPE